MLDSGVITEQQLQIGLNDQQELKIRLGDALVRRQFITEKQLADVLVRQLGIPYVMLHRYKIDEKVINLVSQRIAERHLVVPLAIEGGKLRLAMADPMDYFAIDEVRMATGLTVEPAIASRTELRQAVQQYYGLQESIENVLSHLPEEVTTRTTVVDKDTPVVRMVNQMIGQAVLWGASDIHLDPQEDALSVRFRIDGTMRKQNSLPIHMQGVVVARIKIMAGLNVAERRNPQDGHIQMEIGSRRVDIRVATLPTIHGEKVVMRILDSLHGVSEIESLGFSEANLPKFTEAINRSHGLILITGPTGSGKTTTLYSALQRLNSDDVNIITVEDPVEYQLAGINQVQVNPAVGLTFAQGLRAILRQDPNIVMIGEIRDQETAGIAVRASLTGHLVLSTLHTMKAASAITRLIDTGVEPFLIASSLSCVVAQRLVRHVCPSCSAEYTPSDAEKRLLEVHRLEADRLVSGAGCQACGFTGYRGRRAIHEVLVVDGELRSMMMKRSVDREYEQYALQSGMAPIVADGLAKAAAGITTVAEVLRVTVAD